MIMNSSEDVCMQMSDENDVTMTPCHGHDLPQLEPASEGDESSLGSEHSSSSFVQTPKCHQSRKSKKRVSWNQIQTREFALVVGDHPLCQDGLPVALDWQHTDTTPTSLIAKALEVSERRQSYVFPRRLSYEERRQRICSVSGLTEDQVKNDEIDLVVRTLKESWAHVATENMPLIEPSPIQEDPMMIWDDMISQDLDVDLGDISDFEWTD